MNLTYMAIALSNRDFLLSNGHVGVSLLAAYPTYPLEDMVRCVTDAMEAVQLVKEFGCDLPTLKSVNSPIRSKIGQLSSMGEIMLWAYAYRSSGERVQSAFNDWGVAYLDLAKERDPVRFRKATPIVFEYCMRLLERFIPEAPPLDDKGFIYDLIQKGCETNVDVDRLYASINNKAGVYIQRFNHWERDPIFNKLLKHLDQGTLQ